MSQIPADAAAHPQRLPRHRQRWLVIFNCQAMGLANCLDLLCDEIDVDYHDPSTFTKNRDSILAGLHQYDRVIIDPWLETHFGLDLSHHSHIGRVPAFRFSGYHPDLCHLSVVGGPMWGQHSALAVAAFRCALDVQQTLRLYREEIYSAMGYFDHWPLASDLLVRRFQVVGLDIRQAFVDWSRHGPFTYIPDHPKIRCLRDIAKVVLTHSGMQVTATDLLPVDSMVNGGVFPVYPEIGCRVGVRGNYLFRRPTSCRLIDLEEFVDDSFQFYRTCDELTPTQPYEALLERATMLIRHNQ